ncbi:MAG: EAL domain-containing response regulator [Xanthobacteraceae bacterium]|nr:EAL domain-containing response regulator [Xanthobacteraceae bacterium]
MQAAVGNQQSEAARAQDVPTPCEEAASAAPNVSPICFVVDDEPGIRNIVTHSLHDFGIRTDEFDSAPAVIEALAKQTPDLFFLDVSLSGSDAIDVIRGLGMHCYRGTIQLMSGKDLALLEEIRRVGERHSLRMLPVLQKPFRAEAIRKIIRENFGAQVRNASPEHPAAPSAGAVSLSPWVSLEEILKKNWLELWYQPKIDLKARCLVGAEGLARARHPEHGIIPPGSFLPNADEASMLKLTETVLITALADWVKFAEQGSALRLALNVPVSALVKLPISSIVREHRPKSENWPGLILEVTEDQIVRDIQLAHEIATQLKIYDITLAIDDFGTGYSHLARLRDLPFAELKLDRNLVMNCGEDETSAALCQTAIDLAHRLGTVAVAEGIEKNSELEAVYRMGCDLGQGYLFAPPMPRDKFVALLRTRSLRKPVYGDASNQVA